jgi:hypothetical protein
MQRVTESVTTDKSADAIFNVIKDPKNISKWSLLIDDLEELSPGNYTASTRMGPLKFKWEIDEGDKKCTLSANVMGTSYSAYYSVSEEGGKTVIKQDLPLNPMSTEDQIKEGIKQECQKIIELA